VQERWAAACSRPGFGQGLEHLQLLLLKLEGERREGLTKLLLQKLEASLQGAPVPSARCM
jgi:hypothetical protein